MDNIEKILDLMNGYGYDCFINDNSIYYSKDGFTHNVSIKGIEDLLSYCELSDITAIMKELHKQKKLITWEQ
jgi:hypothetical protein